ncbi:unnamed protein product [Durusdinium trenchii]|uniref:Uncharacterized protein n=2 Tax=Durusdinium trenchii TaxID=1381693 RepID=A0ABP0HAX0_9DINO
MEDTGWQSRLCLQLCAPPIPRLFFRRTAWTTEQLALLEKQAWLCFLLGFFRSYLNSNFFLGDFMGGGTDLFAALLAIFGIYNVCSMNGSFLIMFLVWASANIVLFNLFLSLTPNLLYGGAFKVAPCASTVDNLLMVFNSILQAQMCWRARQILDEALPNWRHQMTGTGASAEPFLQADAPSAPQGPSRFQAFGGGGQRLGS